MSQEEWHRETSPFNNLYFKSLSVLKTSFFIGPHKNPHQKNKKNVFSPPVFLIFTNPKKKKN